MNKYKKGKIYKITCNKTNLVYIGSTIESLKTRLSKHMTDYNLTKKGINRGNRDVFKVFENGDYKMELIQHYACENKNELLLREGEYQIKCPCINRRIAGTKALQLKRLKEDLVI